MISYLFRKKKPTFIEDNLYYSKKIKLATIVEGDPKAPFSIATTPWYRGECYSIPGIATLDSYLIMLSAKQGRIKYHFLRFCYDLTWDWNLVSPDHWRTLYSLDQIMIWIFKYLLNPFTMARHNTRSIFKLSKLIWIHSFPFLN